MSQSDLTALQQAIQERWSKAGGPKVTRYVGKFWDRQRRGRRITAVVQGNHGDYMVVIEAQEAGIWSACKGMTSRHLSAVKSSERRNRHFHELGATKLAVLWVFVEHQFELQLARQEVADSEANYKLLKTIINDSAIIGEPVAKIEIEAIEVEAAKAAAIKKLRQTIDVLNFFCDLVPFIMGYIFIPGESEKTFANSLVRTEQAPILQFGSIPSGPLTQFSFVKLLESNVQYKLGYSKIIRLLAKKQNKLEERLLSAIQWCGRATIAQSNEMAFLLFAISLESLILLDGGGAIVNRLRLRVAHLLGKNLAGRQTISSKVKGLYAIRSKIVHNGSFEVTDADLSLIRLYAKTCINELVTNEKFAGIDKQDLVDWFDRQLLKTDD